MDEPLFPTVTFKRVFDVAPVQEVLTLQQLVEALKRFECRPETQAAVERERGRVARAKALVDAGSPADGRFGHELTKARAEALAAGKDPLAAVATLAARLDIEAKKDAKKDLRVWSPALYRAGERRGSDNVVALGCLVLDYDANVVIEDAIATWESWFFVLHTTWSHQDHLPRFRVVLPLARLVLAEDWAAVWRWGAEQAGNVVDPALKGTGSTFALPAIAGPDAPHFACVNPGTLLDPEAEGVRLRPADLPLVPHGPSDGTPSSVRRLDSRHTFVVG